MGNEGHGLTDAQIAVCDHFVYIPQALLVYLPSTSVRPLRLHTAGTTTYCYTYLALVCDHFVYIPQAAMY